MNLKKKIDKFKSMLLKVKYVAKNVIYLKGWSKKNLDKKLTTLIMKIKLILDLKTI